MFKFKRTLLHGLLFAVLTITPLGAFAMESDSTTMAEPHVEKTYGRFNFGVYYGRPYFYRPYYYYSPYRPYYYHHYYYRPYYRW